MCFFSIDAFLRSRIWNRMRSPGRTIFACSKCSDKCPKIYPTFPLVRQNSTTLMTNATPYQSGLVCFTHHYAQRSPEEPFARLVNQTAVWVANMIKEQWWQNRILAYRNKDIVLKSFLPSSNVFCSFVNLVPQISPNFGQHRINTTPQIDSSSRPNSP